MQTLNVTREKGYIVLQLDHGKVNAIDTNMVEELLSVWLECSEHQRPPGIILTGRPNCFSAGLNLFHQLELDNAGIRHFWKVYHLLIKAMIEYPAPVVGALTGYAPAGATILALCTDYRIMATGKKHQIGMHEFVMSLQIPKVLAEIYASAFGENRAWESVMNKRLFNAHEAVSINLVHEACEVDEVLPKAKAKMSEMIDVKPAVFANTKKYLTKGKSRCVGYDQDSLDEVLNEIMNTSGDMDAWVEVKKYLSRIKSG